ncbi:hypothetical protein AHAS_Ahas10G0110700 [Arachis hypogaea]
MSVLKSKRTLHWRLLTLTRKDPITTKDPTHKEVIKTKGGEITQTNGGIKLPKLNPTKMLKSTTINTHKVNHSTNNHTNNPHNFHLK